MNIKKIITLVTAVTLTASLSLGSVVRADSISEEKRKLMIASGEILPEYMASEEDVKIKREEAIKIAKKLLEEPDSYEVSYVNLTPRWESKGQFLWNVEFYKNKTPGGSASVTVDADTGDVLSFYNWDYYDGQRNFVAQLTRTEAKAKAEEYLANQLNEDIGTFIVQQGDPYIYERVGGVKEPVIYNFYFMKKVNDIPFRNYTVFIGVDGTTGKVRNFNYNRVNIDSAKFPALEGAIGSDKAVDIFTKSSKLTLQYINSYEMKGNGSSQTKPILAYVPNFYVDVMDAMSGKPLSYDGTEYELPQFPGNDNANLKPMRQTAKLKNKPVSEDEVKVLAEKYKAAAEGILGISFDANDKYRPNSYNYDSRAGIWNFNWYRDDVKDSMYMNLSISGKTGNIIYFNIGSYGYYEKIGMEEQEEDSANVESIQWSQAKQKALQTIRKLVPEQYGFYADINKVEPQYDEENLKYINEYYFTFPRVVDGLLYRDNSMGVNIDSKTGNLKSFYFNWTDAEFPAKSNAISNGEAAELFSKSLDATLAYLLPVVYDKEMGIAQPSEDVKLIYAISTKGFPYGGNFVIDATTGKIVDWSGKEIKFETSGDPELSEHWAKRSVELLIGQGILRNRSTDYDSGVTKADAVRMMSIAKGMGYYYYDPYTEMSPSFTDVSEDNEYYYYIENAVRQKILTETGGEFKGSENITKEEFVKLMVNLIGYYDIAKYKEIFTVSGVSNVSEDAVGYVAIAKVLGILPVNDGETFDGKEEITYAQAAVSLYKALSHIK